MVTREQYEAVVESLLPQKNTPIFSLFEKHGSELVLRAQWLLRDGQPYRKMRGKQVGKIHEYPIEKIGFEQLLDDLCSEQVEIPPHYVTR